MLSFNISTLLACWLACQTGLTANLDFAAGSFEGWEGEGFSIRRTAKSSPGAYVVTSEDSVGGKKALLHRAFVIPRGTKFITVKAAAITTGPQQEQTPLDIVLLSSGKRVIPKQVHLRSEWQPASSILPPSGGMEREYRWPVAAYIGQMVRIALIDEDDRPGCYLVSTGFRMVGSDGNEEQAFTQFMTDLAARHQLAPMVRYDTPHFMAVSNAEEGFSQERLNNCELMYAVFSEYFSRKGFAISPPPEKLMVAMFDSEAGFEAYLGQKIPATVTGLYHPRTNRFVMYDFGQNREYVSIRRQGEERSRAIPSLLERQRYLGAFQRRTQDIRVVANIGTIMHEVAHQLSFNCGMLNREGDVPTWVAEGLACYCEATRNGAWQGIGEPNPERLRELTQSARDKGGLVPLRKLVQSKHWLQIRDSKLFSLYYAQSWALFSMLMEEKPEALRAYLETIYSRQTNERRAADFEQAFGGNWAAHDHKFDEYVRHLVGQYGRSK